METVSCLDKQAMFAVKDGRHGTPQPLPEIPDFGAQTLRAVEDVLEKVGFYRRFRATGGAVAGPEDG